MGLRKYRQKRSFVNTPEPAGKKQGRDHSNNRLIFVIQRHDATRLHYDLRLEMDGVLKSWAVPKGPSMNPQDRRLAMHVEDHPMDYATFSGRIPEGNYGAGMVEIWDRGHYTPVEEDSGEEELIRQLEEGLLKIILHGRKVKGEFALVKTGSLGENAWLLIKHRDKFAIDSPYNAEDHIPKSSKIPRGGSRRPGKKEKLAPFKPLKRS